MPITCITYNLSLPPHHSHLRSVLLSPFLGWSISDLRGEKFIYNHPVGSDKERMHQKPDPVAYKISRRKLCPVLSIEKHRDARYIEKIWEGREATGSLLVWSADISCSPSPSVAHLQDLPWLCQAWVGSSVHTFTGEPTSPSPWSEELCNVETHLWWPAQ